LTRRPFAPASDHEIDFIAGAEVNDVELTSLGDRFLSAVAKEPTMA
jgi:hypothetical protein